MAWQGILKWKSWKANWRHRKRRCFVPKTYRENRILDEGNKFLLVVVSFGTKKCNGFICIRLFFPRIMLHWWYNPKTQRCLRDMVASRVWIAHPLCLRKRLHHRSSSGVFDKTEIRSSSWTIVHEMLRTLVKGILFVARSYAPSLRAVEPRLGNVHGSGQTICQRLGLGSGYASDRCDVPLPRYTPKSRHPCR